MEPHEIKRLYRTGRLEEAVTMARLLDPKDGQDAQGVILGVRALMELGRFSEAEEMASAAAKEAKGAEQAALNLNAAFAALMLHPRSRARERVRSELMKLAVQRDAFSQALAKRWETRLLAFEIALFVRPLTAMPEVVAGFEVAAQLFREAGLKEEAGAELLRAAEQLATPPYRDATKARMLLEQVRAEAAAEGDLPSIARASLALAELGFEDLMGCVTSSRDETAVRAALESFEAAMELFRRADMAAGDADVRAALGRKLMKYGEPHGAVYLREAAELWEKAGQHATAEGAWRDLHLWHTSRADREEAEVLEEKLNGNPAIASRLTETTSAAQQTQAALTRGDFATALEISAEALKGDLDPGQAASLLLLQSAAQKGRGDQAEASRVAAEAVAKLRPAEPCLLLGDALFQLGSVQAVRGEQFRLWEEAAQVDLACGLTLSAAQRYANLAEVLTQSDGGGVLPDGRTADALFQQAENLAGDVCDLESAVLRGNIAQRRGLAAFRAGDFPVCGRFLTEAENHFRFASHNADLAFTLGYQGLVLFQIARKGRSLETFARALERFEEAASRFQRQDVLGEQFRMERLAGAASWEAGALCDGAARDGYHQAAAQHMTAAASLMEVLRLGRQDSHLPDHQNGMDAIAAEMGPFLDEAFRFHLNVLRLPSAALAWLEKGKARGLLDMMAANRPNPPPDLEPALAEEERELEAARQAIAKDSYKGRKQWANITGQLKQLWRTMAEHPVSAAYGSLRLGLPMDGPRWQEALRTQGALPQAAGRRVLSIHYAWPHNQADPIRLMACRSDWDEPRMAEVSTVPRKLEGFLHQCFGGTGRSSLSAWLRAAGDSAWCESFAPLVAPLREWSAPGDILIIIPHGPLHSAPLNALMIDGQPLAARNALCFAPSAAIQRVCWERQRGQPGNKASVMGCPNPGSGFPSLNHVDAEAAEVAKLISATPLISDSIATDDFGRAISGAWAVHFAGHASESNSGWESGLQLGNGHVFTARDFFHTRLCADIFTLSGCRTARSRRREGDEMLGLIPALLYAGANSVLASQWEAEDRATATVMRHFYSALQGEQRASKADALRAAIASTRCQFPEMPHWAAFTLHGDWK